MLKKYCLLLLCLFQISAVFSKDVSELPEHIRVLQQKMKDAYSDAESKCETAEDSKETELFFYKYVESYREYFDACKAAGFIVSIEQENPKLFALCEKVRKDLGITEKVPFYVIKNSLIRDDLNPDGSTTSYKQYMNSIILNQYGYSGSTYAVYIIAHELGHYLQSNNDPKSYHKVSNLETFLLSSDLWVEHSKKLEIGAEANACGYFDCVLCLNYLEHIIFASRNYWVRAQGYYGVDDIQPFIERARLDGQLCAAHAKHEKILSKYRKTKQDMQKKRELALGFIASNGDFLRKVLNDRYVDDGDMHCQISMSDDVLDYVPQGSVNVGLGDVDFWYL